MSGVLPLTLVSITIEELADVVVPGKLKTGGGGIGLALADWPIPDNGATGLGIAPRSMSSLTNSTFSLQVRV